MTKIYPDIWRRTPIIKYFKFKTSCLSCTKTAHPFETNLTETKNANIKMHQISPSPITSNQVNKYPTSSQAMIKPKRAPIHSSPTQTLSVHSLPCDAIIEILSFFRIQRNTSLNQDITIFSDKLTNNDFKIKNHF